MKVYSTDAFSGHYPIGTAAVVVAASAEEAAQALNGELKKIGLLEPGDRPVTAADMKHVGTRKPEVRIIRDGSY